MRKQEGVACIAIGFICGHLATLLVTASKQKVVDAQQQVIESYEQLADGYEAASKKALAQNREGLVILDEYREENAELRKIVAACERERARQQIGENDTRLELLRRDYQFTEQIAQLLAKRMAQSNPAGTVAGYPPDFTFNQIYGCGYRPFLHPQVVEVPK